jgi:hypothetical protein
MIISNLHFQENIVETIGVVGGSAIDILTGPNTDKSASTVVNGATVSLIRLQTQSSAIGLLSANNHLDVSSLSAGLGFVSGASVLTSSATTPEKS